MAIFFLSISLNMCFGCSKEPSHRDVSFEYPQHMFWLRNKNNNFHLSILRGVEIATFYTYPGTSKWQYCTCPQKILLVPKRQIMHKHLSLALTVLKPNVNFFVNNIKPDINSIKNSVDPDQLAY